MDWECGLLASLRGRPFKGKGREIKIVFYLVSTGMIVLTNYTPEYEFCTSQLDISILCSINMALCPARHVFFLSYWSILPRTLLVVHVVSLTWHGNKNDKNTLRLISNTTTLHVRCTFTLFAMLLYHYCMTRKWKLALYNFTLQHIQMKTLYKIEQTEFLR